MTDRRSDTASSDSPESSRWEAIARHMTGESSSEESAQLESTLATSPEERQALEKLERITAGLELDGPADLDVEAALAKVKARPEFAEPGVLPFSGDRRNISGPPARHWLVPMPALAAVALLAVGVASWMAYRSRPLDVASVSSPRMLGTGVGIRDSMVLADGTRIIIGPLSSVKVAEDYGRSSREVEVRGDAWFDVVHNERKPFVVHAGDAAITDVGTQFTVRSDDPAGVSVSVTEGAVSLRQVNMPPQAGVILKAGDNGLMKTDGQVVARRGAATEDDIAWTRGRLVFRDATLGEVVSSMRKWYGIEMKVTDRSLRDRHLTATFAGETPDRVLEIIRLALGADIERRGDTAFVRPVKRSTRSR